MEVRTDDGQAVSGLLRRIYPWRMDGSMMENVSGYMMDGWLMDGRQVNGSWLVHEWPIKGWLLGQWILVRVP